MMCTAMQAQRLEAACRQASEPLPVVLHRRRERASLHARLLGEDPGPARDWLRRHGAELHLFGRGSGFR